MAGNDVRIVVVADTGKAEAELKGLHGVAQKVGTAFGDMAKIAGGFVLGQGITSAAGFLKEAAMAATEDAAATERLNQALRNVGGAFDENKAKVEARIKAGQDLAFTDDQVRDSFQTLLAATGDVDEALRRQALAMDFSRGAGISLEQASKLLGKVTDENVEVFKRMGITIGEGATEAEAFAVIQAKFAGQADVYAQSTAGQFEQTKIKMGELKEQIGTALMPAMAGIAAVLVDKVIPAIEQFAEDVGPKVREFMTSVKKYWEEDAKPAIENLQRAFQEIWPVIKPILEQFIAFVELWATVFANTVGIIVDLISGDFDGAWKKAQNILREFEEFFDATMKNAAEFVRNLGAELLKLGEWAIDQLRYGAQAASVALMQWFMDLPGEILRWIGDLGQILYDVAKRAGQRLGQGIIDGIKSMAGSIAGALDPRNIDIPGLSPLIAAYEHAGALAGQAMSQALAANIDLAPIGTAASAAAASAGAAYNANNTGSNWGTALAPGAIDLLSNTGQHGMPGGGGLVYDSVKQLYVKPSDLTVLGPIVIQVDGAAIVGAVKGTSAMSTAQALGYT